MKTLSFILAFLLLPIIFYGQKSLTGLWTGTLTNDSTTIRKDQSYEIALTQYKQKVYGYSRSSFIVNDTLFYVVKRVKGTIEGDICEVKDDEIITSNFPGRRDKGVKVTTTFKLNKADSTWQMLGDWKTNRTKHFYSISGKIELREETNLDNSKIFPHLEELKLAKDVAFYTEAKQAVNKASEQDKPKPAPVTPIVKPSPKTADSNLVKNPVRNPTIEKQEKPSDVKPAEPKVEPAIVKTPELKITEKEKDPLTPKPETKTIEAPAAPVIPVAAARVLERKTAPIQELFFSSDSIEIAIYDNGEVDGDTVSVLLDGEILLSRQGLRSTAIRKTIYIDPSKNEVRLVLYAENLGKYPPNTGLLVVKDGDNQYQVRFTADLEQNAEVRFRRRE